MPRYIAKYRAYSHKGIDRIDQETHWQTGKDKHPGVMCDFKHGGLSPWEKEEALTRFHFSAPGHDEDLSHRLSYFDTDLEAMLRKWSPEDKRMIEERLESSPSFGVDFIRVDKPTPRLPYAAWERHRVIQGRRTVEHVLSDARGAMELTGVTPDQLIVYETEVGGSPDLIAALETLKPKAPEPETVVAA